MKRLASLREWPPAARFGATALPWALAASLAQAGATCGSAATDAAGVPSPATTYEDHGDGTVTDRRTRLTWLRCAVGQRWTGSTCEGEARPLDWREALGQAEALNRSGDLFFKDWRVPQLRELATLAERGCDAPRIDARQFPATPPAAFWSQTARASVVPDDSLYVLSFGAEGVRPADRQERHHVRLVRSSL